MHLATIYQIDTSDSAMQPPPYAEGGATITNQITPPPLEKRTAGVTRLKRMDLVYPPKNSGPISDIHKNAIGVVSPWHEQAGR